MIRDLCNLNYGSYAKVPNYVHTTHVFVNAKHYVIHLYFNECAIK